MYRPYLDDLQVEPPKRLVLKLLCYRREVYYYKTQCRENLATAVLANLQIPGVGRGVQKEQDALTEQTLVEVCDLPAER